MFLTKLHLQYMLGMLRMELFGQLIAAERRSSFIGSLLIWR